MAKRGITMGYLKTKEPQHNFFVCVQKGPTLTQSRQTSAKKQGKAGKIRTKNCMPT